MNNILLYYVHPILFIYLSVGRNLGCFHILPIVNTVTMKCQCKDSSLRFVFHFLWIYTQKRDCWIIRQFCFWGPSILFSIMSVSIYNSTKGSLLSTLCTEVCKGSLLSTLWPTFVTICLFDNDSILQLWGEISLWFWLAFPW